MTIHTLAADICDRIPEMARDCKINNQKVIETMIREFLDSTCCSPMIYVPEDKLPTIDEVHQMFSLSPNPIVAEFWDKKNT